MANIVFKEIIPHRTKDPSFEEFIRSRFDDTIILHAMELFPDEIFFGFEFERTAEEIILVLEEVFASELNLNSKSTSLPSLFGFGKVINTSAELVLREIEFDDYDDMYKYIVEIEECRVFIPLTTWDKNGPKCMEQDINQLHANILAKRKSLT